MLAAGCTQQLSAVSAILTSPVTFSGPGCILDSSTNTLVAAPGATCALPCKAPYVQTSGYCNTVGDELNTNMWYGTVPACSG